jgi:DNA mismatch repair protein MutS2
LGDIRESVADDRRVLAVTASYKNRAQGAFHGSSSKQSLVFLEPGECLEINAEVALLREEETKEIRRILKALTAQLAPLREPLMASAERLIDLDFLNAKARFAFDEGACLPTVHRYGKGQDRPSTHCTRNQPRSASGAGRPRQARGPAAIDPGRPAPAGGYFRP